MKLVPALVMLALAALLSGCLPVTTQTPVGTTTGLGTDQALYGTWRGHNEKDKNGRDSFFHILKATDGTLSIVAVQANGDTDDGWTIYAGRTATLGRNHYLNATIANDNGTPVDGTLKTSNFPVLYVVTAQTLTLYLLDEDKVRAAIKDGKISGTTGRSDSDDVVITAGAAELDAFMATPEARSLFRTLIVLRKVT